MSGRILGVKERWQLGAIDLETSHTEGELLALAASGQRAPQGWDLSAMAVAIAASRELRAMHERVAKLEGQVEQLTRIATAAGLLEDDDELDESADYFARAAAALKPGGLAVVPDVHTEMDPEELQADYDRRLAKVKAIALAGPGWAWLVSAAFDSTSHRASNALLSGEVQPQPAELAILERWIDQNATRKPGSSL